MTACNVNIIRITPTVNKKCLAYKATTKQTRKLCYSKDDRAMRAI